MEKFTKVTLRGDDRSYKLTGEILCQSEKVKDLGVIVSVDLICKPYFRENLMNSRRVLHLCRNFDYRLNVFVKLGLYKRLILPTLQISTDCHAPQQEGLI